MRAFAYIIIKHISSCRGLRTEQYELAVSMVTRNVTFELNINEFLNFVSADRERLKILKMLQHKINPIGACIIDLIGKVDFIYVNLNFGHFEI